MRNLFFLSLLLLVVTYAGYPAVMLLLARLRRRPVRTDPSLRPSLSVIIPARDEEAVIGTKIESVLAQAWPPERLEVIVVDDGSRDRTAEVARSFLARGVRVISRSKPSGKAAALDAGVSASSGDVLVLTDARQPLAPDALPALLAPFGDPKVGAVSGELALRPGGGGLGFYRRLDDAIRRAEAATGSSVGVTGALWALRRELWTDLPRGLILDDLYQPLQVARQGRRVIIEPRARVYDEASPDPGNELRRRTRTLAGNFQILRALPWLLSPLHNPLFLRLLGHKLLRLIAPLALAGLLVGNLAQVLAPEGAPEPLFAATLAAQLLFYGLALLDPPRSLRGPLGAVPRLCRAFVLLHVAVLLAAWRFVRGEEGALWRGTRSAQAIPARRRELRA